jgi:hypothetical protein
MSVIKFHGDPGEISKSSLNFEGMNRKFISEGGREEIYIEI